MIVPGDHLFGLLESSATYNFTLDPKREAPYVLSQKISHEIQPDKSDRFLLKLGLADPFPSESYIYLADVTLIYNEMDNKVTKDNLIFGFFPEDSKVKYPTRQILNYTDTFTGANKVMYDRIRSIYLDNNKHIKEIDKAGNNKSNEVKEFVKKIREL